MMGMHGEAWVNTAIQEADLIIALGMRFDDRVTGNLKTYAPNAKKIHIELDPAEINKNVKVDLPLVGDVREILRALLPYVEHRDRSEWIAHIDELKGDTAVRDIQQMPDTEQAVRRARDARSVAAHRGQGAGRDRRGPAPDVGSPVLQARSPAEAPDLGRRSAPWASRCRPRWARASRVRTTRSG